MRRARWISPPSTRQLEHDHFRSARRYYSFKRGDSGSFGDTIDDFGVGAPIDLGVRLLGDATDRFASGREADVANGAMSVTLTLSDTPFTGFSLMDDGTGGTLVWGGSNIAPVLGGDRAITVTEGSTVAVTTADLTATDADGPSTQLVYTVTGTSHGTVLKSGAPVGTFHPGGACRQSDLLPTRRRRGRRRLHGLADGWGRAGTKRNRGSHPWNGPVIRGTGKADQLLGGESGDLLSGLAGNDVLDSGPEGSDWLDGGAGDATPRPTPARRAQC